MLQPRQPDRPAAESAAIIFPTAVSAATARLLVVVPPFASPDRPSLGAHIVARLAADAGYPADVLYANLSFAALVGLGDYSRLCHSATGHLLGERIFSRAVYGDGAYGALDEEAEAEFRNAVKNEDLDFAALQDLAGQWADFYAARIAATRAEIVGFGTTFEQTLPALALIARLKRLAPEKRLIVGGANVDGPMAEAVGALCADIDHVFSGESEASLPAFLAAVEAGRSPPRFVKGKPARALDEMPPPDYASYFAQLDEVTATGAFGEGIPPDRLWIPYESSRGCWWGEKHHCTFCGLNALGMGYRAKRADKVLAELEALSDRHPGSRIMMVDNIMPHTYFDSLVPALARGPRLDIFYEQKANLGFRRMRLLAGAGIRRIQPGIESLDTSILLLMRKGSRLRTNLECLRFALGMKIDVAWNLIVDFPGEEERAYEAMAELIPNIVHLQPPSGISHLSIERFSPYFDEREDFGIRAIRPLPAYAAAHPGIADTGDLAYHFLGDYDSAFRRRPDLAERMEEAVRDWTAAWEEKESAPLLEILDLSEDRFLLCDTRPGAAVEAAIVGPAEARICLTGEGEDALADWAVERGYVWPEDGGLIPLAVADEDCLELFLKG